MILDQARDLVKGYMEMFEGTTKTNIPTPLLDQAINSAMQDHFGETHDLNTFAHTLFVEGKNEYDLPSDCIAINRLEVGGVPHSAQRWDYIQDVIDGV